jgi:translation initiation factor 4E
MDVRELSVDTLEEKEKPQSDIAAYPQLPLQRHWTFWMHEPCYDGKYENSRKPLHKDPIGFVQEFWRYYNNIPEPSRFFFKDGERKTVGGVTLEGWSFFEDGVRPDWEDPRNKTGNTITFKASFKPEEIDHVWKSSLVGLVGEMIEQSEHVTGIRIIDRGPNYRLEVWVDTNDTSIVNRIKVWFQSNVMGDVESAVTCFASPHESEKKPPPPPSRGRKSVQRHAKDDPGWTSVHSSRKRR